MTRLSGSDPKERYLSEVSSLLGDLHPNIRRNLLRELRSDIQEAIDHRGRSDIEAVLTGFGTPEVTAHNLRLASAADSRKFPWLMTILADLVLVVLLVFGFSATMTSVDSPGTPPKSVPAS